MSGNGRELGGSFALGPRRVRRAGYGAMQLAGDGVFGPPRDRDEALDTFVKQDGAWLFAERRLMVNWTDTRPSVS